MALFSSMKKPRPLNSYAFTMNINAGSNEEEVLSIPDANLVSFTHTRNAVNEGNSFTLTIMGPLSIDLEAKILTGNKKIIFSYGEDNKSLRSFKGEITGSDVKFEDMAIAFSVNGVASIESEDKKPYTVNWTKNTKLSHVIKVICDRHDWLIGYIEESEPLSEDILQTSMSDTQFLNEVLPKYLKTAEGSITGYKLWFVYDNGKNYINYAPDACYSGSLDVKAAYTYEVYGKGNSTMISFEVENLGEMAFATGVDVAQAKIDKETGEVFLENTKNVWRAIANRVNDILDKLGYRRIFSNSNVRRVKSSISEWAMNVYNTKLLGLTINAKAKIMGNVTLDAGSFIQILVKLDNGKLHYTSGIYRINEIVDTLDPSEGFTSELSLTRFSSSIGDYVEV